MRRSESLVVCSNAIIVTLTTSRLIGSLQAQSSQIYLVIPYYFLKLERQRLLCSAGASAHIGFFVHSKPWFDQDAEMLLNAPCGQLYSF